jgi:AraC-like DNA-binding protein
VYAILADIENAFKWVSHSLASKSSLLLFNFADPLVNHIKEDPRYLVYHQQIYHPDDLPETILKKKQLLETGVVKEYTARLLHYIDEKRPYLNPELSLRSLAAEIDIHPNQLSWLINESLDKNFNEFINHYRVETFKQLSQDPKNARITLMGLAYESGFNSKTVFNSSFKKETGLTPKEFVRLDK